MKVVVLSDVLFIMLSQCTLIDQNTLERNMGGGWGVSKVVATFSHVGGSFNLFMATTGMFE